VTAVQCEGLELRAGYKTLIKNFSFELKFGGSVAVTGPNGLGKTTLLRTLCGVSKPYRGTVQLAGCEIWPSTDKRPLFGTACYLASQPALFLDPPVAANLEFYVRCHGGVWDTEKAAHALRLVGLGDRMKQTARSLSTGQKRRLSLAFLMMSQPRILFLDEPTNGLDADGVALCLESLAMLRKETQSAILIATHDPQLVAWCGAEIDLKRWAP